MDKYRFITIIISIIWGLGLAAILKYLFYNGEYIIVKLPNVQNIKK